MIWAGFGTKPTKEIDVPEPSPAWPTIPAESPAEPEPVEAPELVPA